MNRITLCSALGTLLCLASPAFADTIAITSTGTPTTMLGPSSDSITIDAGQAVLSAPGDYVFQTGNIYIGDSQIPDQVIPFFFYDTVTLNGISQTLSIFGQNNVTTSADVISVFAGAPAYFGSYIFQLDTSSYDGTSLDQNIPLTLSAEVTPAPTPEPASMVLLATGLLGGILMARRLRASSSGPELSATLDWQSS